MFHTIQAHLKNLSGIDADFLRHVCAESNSLANCVLFDVRQSHFGQCPRVEYFRGDDFVTGFKLRYVNANYFEIAPKMTENPHYVELGGQTAQQTIKMVCESIRSYNGLLKKFWEEGGKPPKLPNYRTKGGLCTASYPAQSLKIDWENGLIGLPCSRANSGEYSDLTGNRTIWIDGPRNVNPETIREVRILPRNRCFYAEFVVEVPETRAVGLDYSHAIGIDPGVGNWLTCVSSQGDSFIIDGKKVKSVNQRHNKKVAELKTGKAQGFWSDELASLTEYRNRFMRDAINKTARYIVNRCLDRGVGNVVFGWNKGVKQSVDIGDVNNQNFVMMPTARLRDRIKQLCEEVGIVFTETEESYTSRASFLDNDFLPTYGEKPERWKPSGKRGQKVKGKRLNLGRGGYQTKDGSRINSDCNGAANILRKVMTQLDLDLAKVTKGVLNLPKRVNVFKELSTVYRKRCEVCLQTT
jgi:IS605 OrfB family transposase